MEDDFQDAKQTVNLDGTQVRGYRAWRRHATLAMAAYALLAVAAAVARLAHPAPVLPDDADQHPPADTGMVPLSVPEIQRLITLALPRQTGSGRDIEFQVRWSHWRRRHHARALWYHYRKRLMPVSEH